MAGRVRDLSGGIAGLRGLIDDHSEAVERDLIGLGLRLRWLGTERLTWRDLLVIVRTSGPGSEIFHAMHDDLPRPYDVEFLALSMHRSSEYTQRWLQWAKTEDGSKNKNAPEPERFPWEPKPEGLYAHESMTWEEADDWFGWSAEMHDHMGGGA